MIEVPPFGGDACKALGLVKGEAEEPAKALGRALADEELAVACHAADSLFKLGERAAVAVPDLVRCLQAESTKQNTVLRSRAAGTFGNMGS